MEQERRGRITSQLRHVGGNLSYSRPFDRKQRIRARQFEQAPRRPCGIQNSNLYARIAPSRLIPDGNQRTEASAIQKVRFRQVNIDLSWFYRKGGQDS